MAIQRVSKFLDLIPVFSLFLLVSCSDNKGSFSDKEESDSQKMEEQIDATPAKTLYIMHCESCHGMTGDKGNSGAAKLSLSKISDDQIMDVIVNGNDKGMMPFKLIIPREDERISLVKYVKTLRN